jgi:hypothetical protein
VQLWDHICITLAFDYFWSGSFGTHWQFCGRAQLIDSTMIHYALGNVRVDVYVLVTGMMYVVIGYIFIASLVTQYVWAVLLVVTSS